MAWVVSKTLVARPDQGSTGGLRWLAAGKLPLSKACDGLVSLIHVTAFVKTENQERVQFVHP